MHRSTLFALALAVPATCLAMLVAMEGFRRAFDPTVLIVLLIVVAASAWLAFRDELAFATEVAVTSGTVSGFSALAALVVPGGTPTLLFTGGLALLASGGSIAYFIQYYRGVDEIPDLIRREYCHDAVREVRGVEFAGEGPAVLRSDCVVAVVTMVQNCTDRARTIRVSLKESAFWPWQASRVGHRDPGPFTLGPSEVVRVRIPIHARVGARGQHRLYVALRVSGPSGRRTRRRRAPPQAPPVNAISFTGFLLADHVPLELGGLTVFVEDVGGHRSADELPEATVEPVWSPK